MLSKGTFLYALAFLVVFDQFEPSSAWYYDFITSLSQNSCMPPAHPYNGKYTVPRKGYQYGGITAVGYECDEGYELVGTSFNMCSNKRWVYSTPSCVVEDPCKKHRSCSSNAIGSSMDGRKTCTCKPGYSGDAYKSWGGCEKVCKQPYSFSNLNWTPRKREYNKYDRVTFSCSPGYELRGSSSIMCSSYGIWSRTTPYCWLITTPAPTTTTPPPTTTTTTATTTTTEVPVTTNSSNATTAAVLTDDVENLENVR